MMAQQQMQQLQQLQQQSQQIQEYLQQLDETKEQIQASKEAVRGLEEVEEGKEILARVGAGAYVKAEIKNPEKVVSNIGGDVFEERSNEGAADVLQNQLTIVKDTQQELESQMQDIQQQMQQIQQQMQQQQ